MVKENSNGKMEEFTKDNIIMIKKKALENSNGQMVADLKVNGLMENNKVMEYITIQKEKLNMENGEMDKEFSGLKKKNIN